jgi:hypothetical protein
MIIRIIFLLSIVFGPLGCSQNLAIQAENRQVYQIYQKYMQTLNEERQMSGLPPRPIKSYEDWQKSPGTD